MIIIKTIILICVLFLFRIIYKKFNICKVCGTDKVTFYFVDHDIQDRCETYCPKCYPNREHKIMEAIKNIERLKNKSEQ